jgi:hypothetical protein
VQFEFALVNLVLNARDTINGEGRIAIEKRMWLAVVDCHSTREYSASFWSFGFTVIFGAGATARCPN